MQDLQAPETLRPRLPVPIVRPIDHSDPADRDMLLPLLREYLASTTGEDAERRYAWLYLDNPAGVARTYVACAGREAVGITSLFPRSIRVGEHRLVGAIGGDGYVTPAFRRRGIATALHRESLAHMDEGLSFMFGPPEANNLQALLRAGALLTGAVRRYVRALDVPGLGRWAGRVPCPRAWSWLLRARPSRLRVERLSSLSDPRIQEVWRATEAASEGSDQVLPIADGTFYAWRFGGPAADRQVGVVVLDGNEPVGVAALERLHRAFAIVNVTCPPASFRRVVQAIVASLGDADSVVVQIHVPSRSKEIALSSLGFVPRGTIPFQVHVPRNHPDKALLTRESAWNYMWGDCDLAQVL